MSPAFFERFKSLSLEKKVFFGIIVLAVLARIFQLFAMPDAPMTDSLYHLTITRFLIENGTLPFQGIVGMVINVPVPLYHVLMAVPFMILPVPFNVSTARLFPFIFSFLQLLLSFLLLKRMFPKNWHFGLAFVAIHPLLMFFGALNYVETFATVFVLLSFYIYWRFVETGRGLFLFLMPFALAGMALSKETATVLVPAFFIAFLLEIWKRRPAPLSKKWFAKLAYFGVGSVVLSSAWFLANFLIIKKPGAVASVALRNIAAGQQIITSFESFVLLPLEFNLKFWNFLWQAFESNPFGVSPEIAFAVFSLVTFPVLCFLFYGIAKSVSRREKHSLLLVLCLATSFASLFLVSGRTVYVRILVPVIPLFGIAFSEAFRELRHVNLRRAFIILFSLTAIYSIAFSSLYALHYYGDYNDHLPLYNFIRELPEGSAIAIHSNKVRQIMFISEKEAVSYSLLHGFDKQQLQLALNENRVTHLAETCYRNPWDREMIGQLVEEGFLEEVYKDKCNKLYELRG